MSKAKKQKNKTKLKDEKILFNEKHSLSNHDAYSKKHVKQDAKRLRRIQEEEIFLTDQEESSKLKVRRKK